MIVAESPFKFSLSRSLHDLRGKFRAVIGPGRSGAVASVYASHFLGIPFVSEGDWDKIPYKLSPVLIVDTAKKTGRTMRKLASKLRGVGIVSERVAIFNEPPRWTFWYEDWKGYG